MNRTLYISDLDGTLLDSDSRLSANTVRLLNDVISQGALFSVATARTPATVSALLREVDVNLPLIVMTGGALWDKQTGEYSGIQYMTPESVKAVIKAYRGSNASSFLYTLPKDDRKQRLLVYHFGKMNEIERGFMEERIHNPFKRFEIPETGDSDLPAKIEDAILFFGMQPTEVAERVFENLKTIPDINPMFYHDWFGEEWAEVEAFPHGATKAKAIRRLASMVNADRIIVFGDNNNDISMMLEADMAVAVDNAVEGVKEIAHVVIGKNTEDAVARFIYEDFTGKKPKL